MTSLRFITFFFISMLISVPTLARQNEFEPSLIILNPANQTISPSLEAEIDTLEKALKVEFNEQLKYTPSVSEIEGENFKLMFESQIKLAEEIDFFKNISFSMSNFLQYRLSEVYPQYLILNGSSESTNSVEELTNIALTKDVRYVLSMPEVELNQSQSGKTGTFRVLLYDNATRELLINRSYSGDDTNPGFTFSCQPGSVTCTINNALSIILSDVINIMNSRSDFIARQQMISSKRDSVILSSFDTSKTGGFSLDIVKEHSPDLINGNFYSEIINQDSTQIVAFFIENNKARELNELSKFYPTQIDVKMDGYDPTILPNTYAQIVFGVKYEGSWYLGISNATLFPSNTIESGKKWFLLQLKQLNYFEENSAGLSGDFWEKGLFTKIKDWSITEEYKQSPDIYDTQVREDKPYIGMYEVVADSLKKKKRLALEEFEREFSNNVLRPTLEKLISDQNLFTEYQQLHNKYFQLIYSSDMNGILIPLSINKNSEEFSLHFFYYDRQTNEFFEWIYFDPKPTQSPVYSSVIMNTLNEIVDWNFAYSTLDNSSFWVEYVLKKENGEYVYLERIDI